MDALIDVLTWMLRVGYLGLGVLFIWRVQLWSRRRRIRNRGY